MWAHGCGGTMRGREQGRAPRPSPPIRPGGALTHRTGCTEVRGTFPRLGNHRRCAWNVALSRFMRQAIRGYPGDRENRSSDHRGPQRGRHARLGGNQGPRPAAPVEPSRTAPASPRPAGAVRGPVGPPDADQASTQDLTQPQGRTCPPPTARDFWPWAGGEARGIRRGSDRYRTLMPSGCHVLDRGTSARQGTAHVDESVWTVLRCEEVMVHPCGQPIRSWPGC